MKKAWTILLLCFILSSIGFAVEEEVELDPRLEVLYQFDDNTKGRIGYMAEDGSVILSIQDATSGDYSLARISPKGELTTKSIPNTSYIKYVGQLPGESDFLFVSYEDVYFGNEGFDKIEASENTWQHNAIILGSNMEFGQSEIILDQMSRNRYISFLTVPEGKTMRDFSLEGLSVSKWEDLQPELDLADVETGMIYQLTYGDTDQEILGILVVDHSDGVGKSIQTMQIVKLKKSRAATKMEDTAVIDRFGNPVTTSEGEAVYHTKYAKDDDYWTSRSDWDFEKLSSLSIAYPSGIEYIEGRNIMEFQLKENGYTVQFYDSTEGVSILCTYDFDGGLLEQIELDGYYTLAESQENQLLLIDSSYGGKILYRKLEPKTSNGGMRSLIQEKTYKNRTLARFDEQGFGLLKKVEDQTEIVDFRAPLKSNKDHILLQIPYASIQSKAVDEARNLLIEYDGQVIEIPFASLYCDEILDAMPCQTDATLEIRMDRQDDGSLAVKIQLFVIEQVDAMTKLVHRSELK